MFEPLNIVLRVVLALMFLFAATRLLTKRSLSNLTYFDYVAGVLLGTVAGNLAFNVRIHILNFILSMIIITLIMMLASYLSLKFASFRKFLAGEPTVLIKNGKLLENNMANLNYSYDYLNQQLREEKGFLPERYQNESIFSHVSLIRRMVDKESGFSLVSMYPASFDRSLSMLFI